jgi:hypothetical protein
MVDDQSIMYPHEVSLLQSCQQAAETSILGGASFSSIRTDDYGECDVSLRSYHSSNPGIDETFGFSQQEANELLQERLRVCGLSSRHLHVASNGKCTLVVDGDQHTIDVSIRGDTKAVVISTVVHKGKHQQRSGASYSLMTKMMKHNALLSQAATGGKPDACRVDICDGTFILFYTIGLPALSSNWKLELVLDDFTLKAVKISIDFADTQRFRRRGTRRGAIAA